MYGPNPLPQSYTVIPNTRCMEFIILFFKTGTNPFLRPRPPSSSASPFLWSSLYIGLSHKSIHTSNIPHCLKLSKQPETLHDKNMSFHSIRKRNIEEPILVCWSRKVIMFDLISSFPPSLPNNKTSNKWPHVKRNGRTNQLSLSKLDVAVHLKLNVCSQRKRQVTWSSNSRAKHLSIHSQCTYICSYMFVRTQPVSMRYLEIKCEYLFSGKLFQNPQVCTEGIALLSIFQWAMVMYNITFKSSIDWGESLILKGSTIKSLPHQQEAPSSIPSPNPGPDLSISQEPQPP